MAIRSKHIHRYCKVFSFENLCDILQTLQPLGWAVYGDSFEEVELAALADFMGSSFSSTGGSLEVETKVIDDPFGPPHETEYQVEYRYYRGNTLVKDTHRSTDPDFTFYDREGVKRVLNHQDWDIHGPTHVVLPQRLLSNTVPEMFDVNILFIKEPKKLEMVKTMATKAPIFVCYVDGAANVA